VYTWEHLPEEMFWGLHPIDVAPAWGHMTSCNNLSLSTLVRMMRCLPRPWPACALQSHNPFALGLSRTPCYVRHAETLNVFCKPCEQLYRLEGLAGTLGAGDQAVKQLLAHQVT
jgi:hypothetical protein